MDPIYPKQYYIGVAGNSYAIQIKVNGNPILTLSADISRWNIYPVIITPNLLNTIEVTQLSITPFIPNAVLGFQIYDNTEAEIIAATSNGDLTILYSSEQYVGSDFHVVYNSNLNSYSTSGYSCSSGAFVDGCGFDCAANDICLGTSPCEPCTGDECNGGGGLPIILPTPTPTQTPTSTQP
jgi:hypothetical protein